MRKYVFTQRMINIWNSLPSHEPHCWFKFS